MNPVPNAEHKPLPDSPLHVKHNNDVVAPVTTDAAPAGNSQGAPAMAGDSGNLIYKGKVSYWLGWHALLGAAAATLAGLGLFTYAFWMDAGVSQSSAKIVGLALLVSGAIMFGYVWLSVGSLRFTITTRIVEREQGILMKKIDTLDLGRVKDVEMTQSLMQRMLGLGSIQIISGDRVNPDLVIEDLHNPRPIYEKLRNAVIEMSQRRGIIPLDR